MNSSFKPKTTKTCKECGTEYRLFRTTDPCPKGCKKAKGLASVSTRRERENKAYATLRQVFLNGKICPITGLPATEIHHTNKRNGARLNDVRYWLAVSRDGHLWIHDHPKEAREAGWLL